MASSKDDLITVNQGGQIRSFVYDSLKRLKQATNPESGSVSYLYDADSNLSQKTDARGVVTTYSYDSLNRVTRRAYSDATPQVDYYYDSQSLPAGTPSAFNRGASVGRLVAVLYGGASSSAGNYQGYDSFGRAVTSYQKTDSQSYGFNYGYNLAGEMISQTYPSGRVVTTGYDSAGRISSLNGLKSGEPSKTYLSQVSYASHGAIKLMLMGNGKWEHTDFNTRLQPVVIGLGINASDSSILKLDYNYGTTTNNGNVLTQTITAPKTAGGSLILTQSYVYDALNRLQTASENGAANWQQTYDCDRWGNRAVRSTSYMPSPQLTPQSATATDFSAFNQSTNRLSQSKYPSLLYDGAGNLTRDMVSSAFAYDGENRQITSSVAGVSATYTYDGDGRRVKKVVGNTTTVFVYNVNGQLIAEYTSDPVPPPAGGGGTSYLTSDTLGSTRVVTKADGSVKARYDYLPYGEEIVSSIGGRGGVVGYGGADSTKQKFTSKERDNESGLDYFLARYYSAAQGRFTSPDEFTGGPDELYYFAEDAADNPTFYADIYNPQSLNKYQYCLNNPLRYVDPDGHQDAATETLKWGARVVVRGGTAAARGIGGPVILAAEVFIYVYKKLDEIDPTPQGDGSCPSCDANLQRYQKQSEQNAQNKAQQGQSNADNVGTNPEDPQRGRDKPPRAITEEKTAYQKADKLTGKQKSEYTKILDKLSQGKAGGNQHNLTGDLAGKKAVDLPGSGKGRGKLRVIYSEQEDHIIVHDIQDYHRK